MTSRNLAAAALALSTAVFVGAQSTPCLAENAVSNSVVGSIFGNYSTPGVWAWQIAPPTTTVVQSGRVFTGNGYTSTVGSYMELEIWDDDPANPGQPGTRLAGGTWKIRAIGSWQGTNFDAPVTLQANSVYWIVLTEPGWSTPPIEPGGTQFPMMRLTSTGWTGLSAEALKYRLYCGLLDDAGVVSSGPGCAGSTGATPAVFANLTPNVPNFQFAIEGTGFGSGALVLHAVGTVPNYPTVPIPGAPGCSLLTSLDAVVAGAAGTGDVQSPTASGHVRFAFPIPNVPALSGAYLSSQLASLDVGLSTALPLVTTNGLQITLP
jgi:hypothetical protein